MEISAKSLAAGAVRLAAMTQLGPLAGGLFLAGVGGKLFAEKIELGKTIAEMGKHLASGAAEELFGSALEGFHKAHTDLEKSMRKAASEAFRELGREAGDEYKDWFQAWNRYLTLRKPEEIFAAESDVSMVPREYDEGNFRALWWTRMEATLIGWRRREASAFTGLFLSSGDHLPPPLAELLRERLPETLHNAHEEVLREPEFERSWIAYQQRYMEQTLQLLKSLVERERQSQAARPHPQTRPWNIPAPVQTFQDRPELIEAIDKALKRENKTVLTALHGLGGIGKTQLARRFAELRGDRYRLGAWIEAENSESILASLGRLAPLVDVGEERDQEVMAARVLNEISARSPWLVIFDNAASAEALQPYLNLLSVGHVLITSRNEHWDASSVGVTQWTVDESARFLLDRTGQTDSDAAEGLARDLEGLILALEHAAAYVKQGDGRPLAEYRRVWKEKLKWAAAKDHAYPASVAAALTLSIEAVARESQPAYDLLSLLVWFAPDRIPREELLQAGAKKLPVELTAVFADHEQWSAAIEELGRYSLLRRERATAQAGSRVVAYGVHRVVQQVMRDRLIAQGSAEKWLQAACDVANAAIPFDSDEPAAWSACEALLPHVREISTTSVSLSCSPPSLSRLLSQAGLYLRVRGLYREAREFGEQSLALALKQFGPDHPDMAVRRSNLATILRTLGEHGEARRQIELALESDLKQFGPDHPNVAVHRSKLASIVGNLGENGEARRQIELALESDLKQFGPDHPKVAVRRSNLANILGDLGEHGEARRQIELALESDLKQFGPDHPNVGIHRVNLAAILYHLGEREAASREINAALAVFRKKLPDGHPNIRAAEQWREIIARAAGA